MVLPLLAGLAAPLIGGAISAWGANQANETSERLTQRQIDAQKESSQHSYRWGMEDMKAAGLNPILAYKQGGAGAISGSTYTPQNIGAAAVQGASSASSSAVAASRNQAELANLAADTQLKGSQDKTQAALTTQAISQANLANANSAVAAVQAHKGQMEADLLREQILQAMPKTQAAKYDLEWLNSPEGQTAQRASRWVEAISPWKQLAK